MTAKNLATVLTVLVTFLIVCSTPFTWAQEQEAKTDTTAPKVDWLSKPPSGSAEKTQGLVAMALGGISVIVGVIRLAEKDPCEDFGGPGFCTSNIDDVHAVGAVSTAIGAGAIIFGIIRYNNGVQKAKVYEEWKRKNKVSLRPELRFERDRVHVSLRVEF
jgi:hypothetical protein